MRLIDADALKSALEIEQYNDYDDLLRTEHLIDNAPTIKAFTLADIEEQYRKGLEKGLEETIRCAMCENSMKSERGCNGSCRYDEKLFERIVQAIKDNEVQRPHGEVELREIENSDLPERFTATYCSCLNCKNQHTTHCEPQNKKIYGYCGNWERR